MLDGGRILTDYAVIMQGAGLTFGRVGLTDMLNGGRIIGEELRVSEGRQLLHASMELCCRRVPRPTACCAVGRKVLKTFDVVPFSRN